MRITFSVDERTLRRARQKATAMGKTLGELVRDCLQALAAEDDCEASIAEFRKLSGTGDSRGLRFDRTEIHDRV